jgi:hypothetical protein
MISSPKERKNISLKEIVMKHMRFFTDGQLKAIVHRENNILYRIVCNSVAAECRSGESCRRLFLAIDELERRGYEWYVDYGNGQPDQKFPSFRWRTRRRW